MLSTTQHSFHFLGALGFPTKRIDYSSTRAALPLPNICIRWQNVDTHNLLTSFWKLNNTFTFLKILVSSLSLGLPNQKNYLFSHSHPFFLDIVWIGRKEEDKKHLANFWLSLSFTPSTTLSLSSVHLTNLSVCKHHHSWLMWFWSGRTWFWDQSLSNFFYFSSVVPYHTCPPPRPPLMCKKRRQRQQQLS